MEMQKESLRAGQEIAQLLLREIETFLRAIHPYGQNLKTHTPRALEHFMSKPPEVQAAIYGGFRVYAGLIGSILDEDPRVVFNEVQMLRKVSARLRFVISEDVFDSLTDDMIVEIYDQDFRQIYRSLKFMDLCNYSLLDLLTFEFFELYERSASVNENLFKVAHHLKDTQPSAGVDLSENVPRHVLRERFSEKRDMFNIEFKSMFPIYRWPKESAGVLTTMKAERCSVEPEAGTVSFL